MKKKTKIIIVASVLAVGLYLYFIAGRQYFDFATAKQREIDLNPRAVQLPIYKYQKGLFSQTFYIGKSWKKDAPVLKLKVNYWNHTVSFEDVDAWNKLSKSLKTKHIQPLKSTYQYLALDRQFDYFENKKGKCINYKLLGDDVENENLIIDLKDQVFIVWF